MPENIVPAEFDIKRCPDRTVRMIRLIEAISPGVKQRLQPEYLKTRSQKLIHSQPHPRKLKLASLWKHCGKEPGLDESAGEYAEQQEGV